MRKIKNNGIKFSQNVGKVDTLYENYTEMLGSDLIDKASDKEIIEEYMSNDHVVGFVKIKNKPYGFIHVGKDEPFEYLD